MKEYTYELWQDGICVASVTSIDRDAAERDIRHYAMVFSQDGPVEIKQSTNQSN